MAKRLGNNCRLLIESAVAGTYNEIKGQQNLAVNRNAATIDTSTKDEFPWGSSAPGSRSLSIPATFIPDLPDANGYDRLRTLVAAPIRSTSGSRTARRSCSKARSTSPTATTRSTRTPRVRRAARSSTRRRRSPTTCDGRIGTLKLETAVPDDLHRRLLTSTGCSVAEIAALLEQAVHRRHGRGRPGPAAGRVPAQGRPRAADRECRRRRRPAPGGEALRRDPQSKEGASAWQTKRLNLSSRGEAEAPRRSTCAARSVPLDGATTSCGRREAIATIERTLGCSLQCSSRRRLIPAPDARRDERHRHRDDARPRRRRSSAGPSYSGAKAERCAR
jgi:hypothetical protein